MENRETQLPLNIALTENMKTLGLRWYPATDKFSFATDVNYSQEQSNHTKRSILAEIAKLYDPIGWLQPCIIIGMATNQKLWLTKYDWDDSLEDEIIKDWLFVRNQFQSLRNLRIPRWTEYCPTN